MTWRVVGGVSLAWLLVAVVWGAQSSLGAALQGQTQALGPAIVDALHLTQPWIPGTLAVIALASWVPFTRARWRHALAVHLVGLLAVAWFTNTLVVLGYWGRFGSFRGFEALAREGARWGLIRLHVTAVLYGAIVAVTQGIATWREVRRREVTLARLETQLAQARLQVLNAQIQPHFLFNTLNSVGALVRTGRPDEAVAMIAGLSDLLRYALDRGSQRVTVGEEVEMLRRYLEIQRLRFPDRLSFGIDVSAEARTAAVPVLLLQPLAENAISHGVARSAGPGRVEVRAYRRDGELRIEMSNTGRLAADAVRGIGLANTVARLEELYGARQRFDLRASGEGVTAELTIPWSEVA